ncbi:MAG: hypothetical protein ACRDP7_37145 [Trebonia sp.]
MTEAVVLALRERFDREHARRGALLHVRARERTGYPVLCTGDDFAATDIAVLRARQRRW